MRKLAFTEITPDHGVRSLPRLHRATTELAQRKAERQSCAHFVDWMAVRERMTQPYVETEVIANFPNETDQGGILSALPNSFS
jgi:hypothetical protein